MVRQYELRDDRFLIVYVKDEHWYKKWQVVFTLDTKTNSLSVRVRSFASRTMIESEIHRLFELVDGLHWRDFVRRQSQWTQTDSLFELDAHGATFSDINRAFGELHK